jgi:hypothetical protein
MTEETQRYTLGGYSSNATPRK